MAAEITELPNRLREVVQIMLDDLLHQYPEVIVVPAPQPRHCGHGVRVVTERNPEWWSDFTACYPKNRKVPRKNGKPDTRIVRKRIVQVLSLWLERGWTSSIYAEHLLEVAEQLQEEITTPEIDDDDQVPF